VHRPVSLALLHVTSQNARQLSPLMGFAGVITFVYYMRGDKVQNQENAAYKHNHCIPFLMAGLQWIWLEEYGAC